MRSRSTGRPALKPAVTFGSVLGQTIVKRRKLMKLSQGEAAQAMRLPQSSLSRLERGTAMFTVPQLRRAAAPLKTRVSQLILEAEAGEAALSKKGVTVLDEEPPEEDRGRWVWIATEEIAQVVAAIGVAGDDDQKPRVKRRVDL